MNRRTIEATVTRVGMPQVSWQPAHESPPHPISACASQRKAYISPNRRNPYPFHMLSQTFSNRADTGYPYI